MHSDGWSPTLRQCRDAGTRRKETTVGADAGRRRAGAQEVGDIVVRRVHWHTMELLTGGGVFLGARVSMARSHSLPPSRSPRPPPECRERRRARDADSVTRARTKLYRRFLTRQSALRCARAGTEQSNARRLVGACAVDSGSCVAACAARSRRCRALPLLALSKETELNPHHSCRFPISSFAYYETLANEHRSRVRPVHS